MKRILEKTANHLAPVFTGHLIVAIIYLALVRALGSIDAGDLFFTGTLLVCGELREITNAIKGLKND